MNSTLTDSFLEKGFFQLSGRIRSRPFAWLRVSGPDAAAFLQGQCTQDLRPLRHGGTTWALWLSLKGKVIGESLVLRDQPEGSGDGVWWLWSPHTPGEVLRARLEEFIIADDVTVEPGEDWAQWTLAGPEAEAWLRSASSAQELPAGAGWVRLGDGYLFAGRRGQARIWEWLLPPGAEASGEASLPDLAELRPEDLVRARLAAGVPAIPGEFGPGDLPQEAGLEAVAVSFTKGCYLGQEVMARLHAMGRVRRKLLRVCGTGAAPAAGAVLVQSAEDRKMGELRAAVDDGRGGWLGLAMCNLLGLDAAQPLRLALAASGDGVGTAGTVAAGEAGLVRLVNPAEVSA